jgi:uncharacterized membrane protein YeaQ/YmgE (transglycosylase-associated protein family)
LIPYSRLSKIEPKFSKIESVVDLNGCSQSSSDDVKEETMSFIWMLFVGLIVGALAKLFMPGRDPGGFIITMLLGVAGALVAGFLGRTLGWYREGEPAGFIASIFGAILLLALYRFLAVRRTT